MSTHLRRHKRSRRGSILLLAALLLVVVLSVVAFSVDIGVVLLAKTDLQRSADAAAHAAALEYASNGGTFSTLSSVRRTARDWVPENSILGEDPTVATNWFNGDKNGDIVLGRFDFENPRNPLTFGDADEFNAVRVRIRRNENRNGDVPFFFARVMGHESVSIEGEATAAIIRNVRGFRVSPTGENLPLLPITISLDYWEDTLRSNTHDNWSWDPTEGITSGADGVSEVVLFPQPNGSSGNFGTVNVGHSQNSTSLLANQIRHGLSKNDLDYHGGEIKLNDDGELPLGGDPGLSASLKDDIASVAGEPRMIPLYERLNGDGDSAVYTITKFVGVRVMAVELTGGNKGVTVQPADITVKGLIQGPAGEKQSEQIYSAPTIVR